MGSYNKNTLPKIKIKISNSTNYKETVIMLCLIKFAEKKIAVEQFTEYMALFLSLCFSLTGFQGGAYVLGLML